MFTRKARRSRPSDDKQQSLTLPGAPQDLFEGGLLEHRVTRIPDKS